MATTPIQVTDATFEQEVLKSSTPVVVDFWAAWCGPCRFMAPVIEELAQEYAGKVTFAKVNVDENMTTAQTYGVMSIPTFGVFKNGAEVGRFMGAMSKQAFKKKLEEYI